MKRNHYIAGIILFCALLCITVKLMDHNTHVDSVKPQVKNLDPHLPSGRNQDNPQNQNVIKAPFGKIRFEEHLPEYNMIPYLRQNGFINDDDYRQLASMVILPWQVYLDEQKHVVKITIHKLMQPTLSIKQQLIDDLAINGYDILGSTGVKLDLDDKNMMKHFATLMRNKNYLRKSTVRKGHDDSRDELEMYPVMARYHGRIDTKIKDENLDYLSEKELPMLLVIDNRGIPKDDIRATASDEDRVELFYKYEVQNCMWITWTLLPMPRNDAEAEFFAKAPAPNSVAQSGSAFAPTVSAWERVNGKKYVQP